MKDLWRIALLWRPQASWLLLGCLVSLASAGVGVALLTSSSVLLAGSAAALAPPALVRGLGLSRIVLRYVERLVTHEATFRALAGLRVWFFRGFAIRSAGGLGFRRSGDVLSRLVSDVEALDGLYLRISVPLLTGVVLIPIMAGLIGRYDAGLAVLVVGLLLVATLAIPGWAAAGSHFAGQNVATATSGLRTAAVDLATGLREVRVYGAEGRMLAGLQAREADLFRWQRRVAGRAITANALGLACAQAALLSILLWRSDWALPSIPVLFLTLAAFEAVNGLPRAGALAGLAAASAHRVLHAASGALPLPDPLAPKAIPASNSLRFQDVRFRWQPDGPVVFDGLTLTVPEGTRVALLGPSGAGKSSLAALALKVVTPEAGSVRLGGVDLASLRAEHVRAQIAWLSQATHLFDDTIRANVLLGKPDAVEEDLWRALDQAAVGDWVRSLPKGLDTWLGEGGARASGGQGRRIALARTLLSPAPILILDEPATGLDAETERAFLATLNEATAGRTVILIVHRLIGVERLDRIWRLSAGRAIAAAG